ncbi:Gephyrin [Camponotus japonicus]
MSETAILRCGILIVYTEKDARGDVTAYSTEMSNLIDYIKNTIMQKFDAEVIDILLSFDDMMTQINSWCNQYVDTIFIIGYPYFSKKYKNMIANIYNKYMNNIIKKVEKIITEQISNEKFAYIPEEIKALLEPKFHRSICGIQKKTLIINLFGFNKEGAVTCIDVIVRIMEHKYITRLTHKEDKEKINQATPSSNEATTSSSNEATTSSSNEATTSSNEATTSSSNEDTTSSSNEDTISSSNEATTSSSNEATTSSSNEATTSSSNEATTSSSNEATTSSSNEATTSSSNEATTSSSNEATTSSSNEATTSSSNEATTSSPYNTDQVEEDEIKFHEESYTDEETVRSYDMYEFVSSLSPITKGNDMNKKKSQSFLSPGKLMEMIKLDQIAKHYETFPIDLSAEQLDVASEVTTGAKLSSSETFKTETLYQSPDISMMEELNIASTDKESSLLEVADEKLEDMICEQYPMIAVEEALLKIQRKVKYGRHESLCEFIRTDDAYGRILADHVYSDCDVPAFRCATKHGYAVLTSDGESRRVVLSGTTSDPVSLIAGTCMYVKSGARVPDEATAVVPIKDVKRIIINDHANDLILIKIKPEFGQNIKDIGSDIRKGKLIICPFTRIGPAELGLLAATGRKEVRVVKPISIGILSIGDLLEEPRESLRPGYVYDSNRISLIALLKDQGFNSIADFGIVTDDMLPIKMKIKDALKQVVVLVTIGCSNDNDLLKPILKNDFDATIHFGNVFLKPGKSTTFATCKFDDKLKYLVCLPKNPVSASVSAHLFLLPFLNKLHRIGMPCKIPARIHDRYILHSRPRAAWATLKWNEEDNFARAFSRENLDNDKPSSSQAANALLLFPQQTEDQKVMYESFVPACPIK